MTGYANWISPFDRLIEIFCASGILAINFTINILSIVVLSE